MKRRTLIFAALFSLFTSLFVFAQAQAADAHLRTLAEITLTVHHYPDDAQKAALQKIADDANAAPADRTMAGALLRMQHTVADADKQKLQAIIDDKSAPAQARELAGILSRFQHMASAEDKEKLKAIGK